jgi:hypothetical protein
VILKRLAAVAGVPNAKILQSQLGETRERVREVFERTLAS